MHRYGSITARSCANKQDFYSASQAFQLAMYYVPDDAQLYPSKFFDHQIQCMKIGLCLVHFQYGHLKRCIRPHQTIVKYQLQDLRTGDQSDGKAPFAKKMKEDLSIPVVLHHRRMDNQRCFVNLVHLHSSKLVVRYSLICLELRKGKCSLPPRNLDFRTLHNFFFGWNCRCLKKL